MFDSQPVPSWVDFMFANVLPGGVRWEVDRDAGHRILAARISKWARGSFVPNPHCEGGKGCRLLALREQTWLGGGGFIGSVEVHVVSGKLEFRLHESDDGEEGVLPIAHPAAFGNLLVELTQPLDNLPSCELDGPSWGPALLRPVLPGGHRWDDDRAAGHPVLAARIHRLARLAEAYLDPGKVWGDGPGVRQHDSLQMADRFSLHVNRWKEQSDFLYVGEDADGWQFTLRQMRSGMLVFDPDSQPPAPSGGLPTVRAMIDQNELELEISHPVAFWRLVRELNQTPRFRTGTPRL